MDWMLIVLGSVCGCFYYEIRSLKERVDKLESKVYDLEENTVKKKKEWE